MPASLLTSMLPTTLSGVGQQSKLAPAGGGAGSQHTTLAPADCKRLVELGWAEWHPVAHAGHPLVMVYGPRDDVEMELCLHVLHAAADFFVQETALSSKASS